MTRRFCLEVGLAAASLTGFVITLLWRDWIELLFHVDPDRGSGAVEWLFTATLLVGALFGGALARREWRRAGTATA